MSTNKLLFDGTIMQTTSTILFHGGGEYAKYIFKELIKRNISFDIVLNVNKLTDDETKEFIENEFKGEVIEVGNKNDIYTVAKKERYSNFFTAYPNEYDDYSGTSKFVGVIHGIRAIELPWDKYKHKFYSSPIKRCIAYSLSKFPCFVNYWRMKHIEKVSRFLSIRDAEFITVSYHSKYSILNFFPFLRDDQMSVYYSPFNLLEGEKVNTDIQPYFLMISGNRYEKNVWRAALAFDKLFTDGRLNGYKVVIAGGNNISIWKELKNTHRFEIRGYLSYKELGNLYANAYAFVYPSLNEGFGYPPLQAMALGIPVIASSATSIPEVCGDAACYFSPTSIDDLCSRILRLVFSDCYRSELINQGKKRVKYLLDRQADSIDEMIKNLFE